MARPDGQGPDQVVWVVEHEGAMVGTTAIRAIDWKNGFGTTGTVIGDKRVWGKGLGRELMQLRARYAFTQLPLRKLKSGYLDGNEASARAQAAAGYREVGRYKADMFVDGSWRDHVMTEVLRGDWERSLRSGLKPDQPLPARRGGRLSSLSELSRVGSKPKRKRAT